MPIWNEIRDFVEGQTGGWVENCWDFRESSGMERCTRTGRAVVVSKQQEIHVWVHCWGKNQQPDDSSAIFRFVNRPQGQQILQNNHSQGRPESRNQYDSTWNKLLKCEPGLFASNPPQRTIFPHIYRWTSPLTSANFNSLYRIDADATCIFCANSTPNRYPHPRLRTTRTSSTNRTWRKPAVTWSSRLCWCNISCWICMISGTFSLMPTLRQGQNSLPTRMPCKSFGPSRM